MDDGKAHAGRDAEAPAEAVVPGPEGHARLPVGSLTDARLRAPGAGRARAAMALALQRGLGNAAVQRTLAPRGSLPALLMRAPPTAPEKPAEAAPSGLSLAEGTNFEWGRSGMDFAVVVRRQWLLDNGAAPDDTRISDVRVVRPLVLGIATVAPWAKKDDLEAMVTSSMRVERRRGDQGPSGVLRRTARGLQQALHRQPAGRGRRRLGAHERGRDLRRQGARAHARRRPGRHERDGRGASTRACSPRWRPRPV